MGSPELFPEMAPLKTFQSELSQRALKKIIKAALLPTQIQPF